MLKENLTTNANKKRDANTLLRGVCVCVWPLS